MTTAERNAKILALRGKKSYGLIARELGITRNIVAGVVFRERHPYRKRVHSPGSRGRNKTGTGYRGTGKRAKETLPRGGAAGAGT